MATTPLAFGLETVSRALSGPAEQGLIAVRGKRVRIADPAALCAVPGTAGVRCR